jgi:hypothetical protein
LGTAEGQAWLFGLIFFEFDAQRFPFLGLGSGLSEESSSVGSSKVSSLGVNPTSNLDRLLCFFFGDLSSELSSPESLGAGALLVDIIEHDRFSSSF